MTHLVPQNFKGDATESKMYAVGEPILDLIHLAKDEFYAQGFTAAQFLLMLYDEERIPFSQRIPRDAFVAFFREMQAYSNFTGTFETYLFVLRGIFGQVAEINFDVPNPGELEISINTTNTVEHAMFGDDGGDFFLVDDDDNQMVGDQIAGITSQYELDLLFKEIVPAGINPTVAISFYEYFSMVGDESSVDYNIVDDDDNQFIGDEP